MSYNELCSIDLNGANDKVLATIDTYVAEGKQPTEDQQNVFTFTLLGVAAEADDAATVYYTKTYTIESSKNAGLFMSKVAKNANSLDVQSEKHLTTYAVTTLYPLGYAEGALAYNSQSEYYWFSGANDDEHPALKVTDSSKTSWFVKAGYAYYTDSSSASTLYKIPYKEAANTTVLFEESMKVDWLPLDTAGNNLYFFATNDNNYVHYIDYTTFNKDAEDAKSTMVGIYLDSEKPTEDEE